MLNPIKIQSTNMDVKNKIAFPTTIAESLCNEDNIKEPIMTAIKTEKTDIEKEDEYILPDSALELANTDISTNILSLVKPEISNDETHMNSGFDLMAYQFENESDEPNSFDCKLCNRAFKKRAQFKTHLCKRTLRQRPSVKYCNQKKAIADKLIAEWKSNLECPLCYATSPNFSSLTVHFGQEHPDDEAHVVCCDSKLKSRSVLAAHIKRHGKKFFKNYDEFIAKEKGELECPLCQATFPKFSNLRFHFRDDHPGEKCHVLCCNKELINRRLLVKHIQNHTTQNGVQCKICKRAFNSSLILDRHVKRKHTLNCDQFQISFGPSQKTMDRKVIVKQHIQDHKKRNGFQCRMCKRMFNSSVVLDRHVKRKHTLNCDQFQISFVPSTMHQQKKNKNQSIKAKCDEIMSKWKSEWDCTICQAKLSTFKLLRAHFRNEHPDDMCHVICCNKKLLNPRQIVSHINGHKYKIIRRRFENDDLMAKWKNEWECPLCNSISLNFSLLKIHFKNEHPDDKCHIICCNRKLNRFQIVNHIKMSHNKQRTLTQNEQFILEWYGNLVCSVCQGTFSNYTTLENHFIKDHPGIPCHIICCELSLYSSADIVDHIKVHKLNPPELNTENQIEIDHDMQNVDDGDIESESVIESYLQIEDKVILNTTMGTVEPLNKPTQIFFDTIEIATHSNTIIINSNKDATEPTEINDFTHNVNESFVDIENKIIVYPPNTDTVNDQLNKQIPVDGNPQQKDYQIAAHSTPIQKSINMKTGTKLKAISNDNFIAKWNGDLKCPICKNLFKNYGSLNTHFCTHHPDKKCHVVCCKRKLFYPCHIVDHLKFHINPNAFTCVICGVSLSGAEYLKRHIRNQHLKDLNQANLLVNQSSNDDCLQQKDGNQIMETSYNSKNTSTNQRQITMKNCDLTSDNNSTTTNTNQSQNTVTLFDLTSDNSDIEESYEQHKRNSLEPDVEFIDKVIASSSCYLNEQMDTTDKQQSIEIEEEIYDQNESNLIMETDEEEFPNGNTLTNKMANFDNYFAINNNNAQPNSSTMSSYFQIKGCEEISNPITTGNFKQLLDRGSDLQQEDNQIANDENLIVQSKGKFTCPICKNFFAKFHLLKTHFRDKHAKEKCHIICCRRKLYTPCHIVDHLELHINFSLLQCTICGVSLSGISDLKRHILNTHEQLLAGGNNLNQLILEHDMIPIYPICQTNLMETDVEEIDEIGHVKHTTTTNIDSEQQIESYVHKEDIMNPSTIVSFEQSTNKNQLRVTDIIELDTGLIVTNVDESVDKSSKKRKPTSIKLNNNRKIIDVEKSTEIDKIVCYDLTDEDVNDELISNDIVAKVDLTTHTFGEFEEKLIEDKVILSAKIAVDTIEETINQNPINTKVPYQDDKQIAINDALNKLDSEDFLSNWKGEFDCTWCKSSFAKYSLLKFHFIAEHPTDQCHIVCCRQKLVWPIAIVDHIQSHIGRQIFQCQICYAAYNHIHNLESHFQKVHASLIGEDDNGHSNSIKSYIKTIVQTTNKIRRAAENDKLIAKWKGDLECPLCQDSFLDFSMLKGHFNINHPSEKCFTTCCNIKLISRSHIAIHLKNHMSPNAYQCKTCGKKLGSLFSLKRHIDLMHNDNKVRVVHFCKHCNFKCKTIGKLKRHMKNKHFVDGNTELCNEVRLDESQITFEIIHLPKEANVEEEHFGVHLQQSELQEEEEFQGTVLEQSSDGTKVKQEMYKTL